MIRSWIVRDGFVAGVIIGKNKAGLLGYLGKVMDERKELREIYGEKSDLFDRSITNALLFRLCKAIETYTKEYREANRKLECMMMGEFD